jgi:hypothetical protein
MTSPTSGRDNIMAAAGIEVRTRLTSLTLKGTMWRIGGSCADTVEQSDPVRSYRAGRKPREGLCWSLSSFALTRRPGPRPVARQRPPHAAVVCHVADGVNDVAARMDGWPAATGTGPTGRNQRCQQCRLRVRRVRWIAPHSPAGQMCGRYAPDRLNESLNNLPKKS